MVVICEVTWPIVVVVAVWYCLILHCLYINVGTVKRKREEKTYLAQDAYVSH